MAGAIGLILGLALACAVPGGVAGLLTCLTVVGCAGRRWARREQVDAVPGAENQAGVGCAQLPVVQGGDRGPSGGPGDRPEWLPGGGGAFGDGDFEDLVAGQGGGWVVEG